MAPHVLNLSLDRGEWSASSSVRFTCQHCVTSGDGRGCSWLPWEHCPAMTSVCVSGGRPLRASVSFWGGGCGGCTRLEHMACADVSRVGPNCNRSLKFSHVAMLMFQPATKNARFYRGFSCSPVPASPSAVPGLFPRFVVNSRLSLVIFSLYFFHIYSIFISSSSASFSQTS
jgi:hypothetical protein